ncbi:MAG: hypothetical protein ABW096_14225 [Candidatus Thiodiazotropha sp.]
MSKHFVRTGAFAILLATITACNSGSDDNSSSPSGGDSGGNSGEENGGETDGDSGGDSVGGSSSEIITALIDGYTPPDPATASPVLLYTDIVAGPSGSLVTVWGQNLPGTPNLSCGSETCNIVSGIVADSDHVAHGNIPQRQKLVVEFNSGSGISLAGANTLPFSITNGSIINIDSGSSIDLSSAMDGDVVYVAQGTYGNSSASCGGSNPIVCARSGVAVVGHPLNSNRPIIDCSSNVGVDIGGGSDISASTLANFEFNCGDSGRAIRASRQGLKEAVLVVNNYVHNARSNNSGAFGEFSNTVDVFVVGNRTDTTGVPGENNAHAIYHGGRGTNINFHISLNRLTNHQGGRAIQVYGHRSPESMEQLYIIGNHLTNVNGNAAILVSHTDGQSGTPDDRSWIDSVTVASNSCDDNQIQFRGANLNGGDDWLADSNNCPLNSTMGGDANSWVIVTNNDGTVSGNTR